MGVQKNRWRRQYSPKRQGSINLDQQRQRTRLKTRFQHSQIKSTIVNATITAEIYRTACDCNSKSERYEELSNRLLHRLEGNKPLLSVGEIKDFKIPVKYVKPKNYAGSLEVGTSFDIYFSLWGYKNRYVIMLRNEKGFPPLMVLKEQEGLVGAANFLSGDRRQINYSAFLYDPKKIETLFNFKCVVPFIPSDNYRRV